MKWQGQSDNLIDRFDVRAHLDYIPPVKPKDEVEVEVTTEDRHINYERFRVLAQNEFLGVTEESFLKQLQLEEQFGVNAHQTDNDKGKKKHSQANAAIAYNYEDTSTTTVPFSQTILNIESSTTSSRFEEFSKDYSDESDVDMDVSIDINKIGTQEAHELNNCGKKYGMTTNDFFSYLTKDEDEKQSMKALKEQEADKVLGGGRKSRRERRSQRERRILGKPLSPPSYAAKVEKKQTLDEEDDEKSSRDNSRSPSPEKITYITSFGGEDELQPHAKISIKINKPTVIKPGSSRVFGSSSYADQVKQNLDKLKHINDNQRDRNDFRRRSRSFSPKRRDSRSWSRRRRDSSRSTSHSRRRRYSSRSTSGSRRRRNYSSRSRSDSTRRRTRSSRSYSKTSYSSDRSRSRSRRRSLQKRTSTVSRKRSYTRESFPRRRSESSRKRSISKKRSYSSSSSSTSSTSTRDSTSPEKQARQKSPPPRKKSSTPPRKSKSKSQPRLPIATTSDAAAPIKRYYGRRKDDDSSSSLSVESESDDDDKKTLSNQRWVKLSRSALRNELHMQPFCFRLVSVPPTMSQK